MERFYKTVETVPEGGGVALRLDGRLAKTPAKRPLILPNPALGAAIAAEWRAQGARVEIATMPLTRLAHTVLDGTAANRGQVIAEVSAYAGTDLVCHRAAAPAALVARQATHWEPLLEWLAARHGVRPIVTEGVIPLAQPEAALACLRAVVAGHDDWALTALAALTSALGSLVIALAHAEGQIDAEAAWRASQIDEQFQIDAWGEDAEQAARRASLRVDILAASRFLALARASGIDEQG